MRSSLKKQKGKASGQANRREFLSWLGTGVLGSQLLPNRGIAAATATNAPAKTASPPLPGGPNPDVGSLYPFIYREATRKAPQYSFLNSQFHSVKSWKNKARGKWLELLHY